MRARRLTLTYRSFPAPTESGAMTRNPATALALLLVFSVFADADDPLRGIDIEDEDLGAECSRRQQLR